MTGDRQDMIDIKSETSAVVTSILVAAGDRVGNGQLLATTELMKMRQEFHAPAGGLIDAVNAREGDILEPGTILIRLRRTEENTDSQGGTASAEISTPRLLEDIVDKHAALEDSARSEAVARRQAKGMRTARANLADLVDPGSFVEYGALAVAAQRRKFAIETLREKSPADGIITGIGTVNAEIFGEAASACAVMAVDYTVMAGTQGYFHHKKIDRLLGVLHDDPIPLVVFAEGGGGRPNDVDLSDISFSGLDVPSFYRFAQLSGRAPRVAIVAGRCFAGNAAFAGCADLVIMTRDANLGMGGPAMIEGGGLGRFEPESIGPAEAQWKNGVADLLVEDEAAAVAVAKKYLGYFQGQLAEWTTSDQDHLRVAVPEDRQLAYDIRKVIETLADSGSVLEMRAGFGPGMVTALIRIAGKPLGLIANNPLHLGGAIDPEACDKAARFLQLCDAFGLPMLSLCDTPGFMVGPEIEAQAQVRHTGRLFLAGANFRGAFCTVILRKGYGLGAQAMAGGSFHRSRFTVSWPTGEVGAMGLEGAVRLGARTELAAIEDEDKRKALFDKLVARAYERGKAANAASLVEFDAVIDPAETRRWVLRALSSPGRAGSGPAPRFIDAW